MCLIFENMLIYKYDGYSGKHNTQNAEAFTIDLLTNTRYVSRMYMTNTKTRDTLKCPLSVGSLLLRNNLIWEKRCNVKRKG